MAAGNVFQCVQCFLAICLVHIRQLAHERVVLVPGVARLQARRVEEHDEHPGSFDMAEEFVAEALALAESRRDSLADMVVTISAKAGEEGKQFGSVGTSDIADAIKAAGVDVERNEIRLPSGAFRQTGEYDVDLHLHTDVNVIVKLKIEEE